MSWVYILVAVIILFIIIMNSGDNMQKKYDKEAKIFLKMIFQELKLNTDEISLRDTTRLVDYLEGEYFLKHSTLKNFDAVSEIKEIQMLIIKKLDIIYDIKEYFVFLGYIPMSKLIKAISDLLSIHQAKFYYLENKNNTY